MHTRESGFGPRNFSPSGDDEGCFHPIRRRDNHPLRGAVLDRRKLRHLVQHSGVTGAKRALSGGNERQTAA
jgi:hypothetical protein